MNFECIIYEKSQGIATVKLNRPKVLNAMNKQLWLDFQAALADAGKTLAESDPEVSEPWKHTGIILKSPRKPPAKLFVLKSRPSLPLTDMPSVPDMNWLWPAISG